MLVRALPLSHCSARPLPDRQAWLKRLHEMHAEHMAQQAAASQLPAAPMIWAVPEEANSPAPRPSGFGGGVVSSSREMGTSPAETLIG